MFLVDFNGMKIGMYSIVRESTLQKRGGAMGAQQLDWQQKTQKYERAVHSRPGSMTSRLVFVPKNV